MEQHDRIIEILARIEANQVRALEVQEQQLAFARDQLDMSTRRVQESMDLQRLAVARQGRTLRFGLPVIVALLILLGYLLVKWRVL